MATIFSEVTETTTAAQLISRQLHDEEQRHSRLCFEFGGRRRHNEQQAAAYQASVRQLKHRTGVLREELARLDAELYVRQFAEWAETRRSQLEEARLHGDARMWVANAMDLRQDPYVTPSADLPGVHTVACVYFVAGSAEHARELFREWRETQEGAADAYPINVPRTAIVVATLAELQLA